MRLEGRTCLGLFTRAVRTGPVVLGYGEEGVHSRWNHRLQLVSAGTFEENARLVTDRALADVVRIRFGEDLPVFHIEAGGCDLIDGGNCLACGSLKDCGAQPGLVTASDEYHVGLPAFVVFVTCTAVVYRGEGVCAVLGGLCV